MDDLDTFVKKLLETPPGKPHSVQLEIDTAGDVHGLFEALLLIMTKILKTWYTPPITLSAITLDDGVKLQRYFASFGIVFTLEKTTIPRVLQIQNRKYLQESQLECMKFQMSDNTHLYTVYFSTLPTVL